MSLRARLVLLSALTVAVAVVVTTVVAYVAVENRLRDDVDDALRTNIVRLARVPALEAALPFFDIPGPGPRFYLQIVNADGSTRKSEGQPLDLEVTPIDLAIARGTEDSVVRDVRVDGRHFRMATAPVSSGKALQMARPVTEVDETISDLRFLLIVIGAASVGIVVLLAFVMAGVALRPVRRLTKAAERVAETQDLAAPIEVGTHDELGRLATSLNAMLSALDTSRQQQRQLISDAGHELRTPLTSLRTNIELLAGRPDMPEAERERLLADVTTQLEELTTLMEDVVELARADEGDTEERVDVDLDAVVLEAIERTRPRAGDVTIDVLELHPTRVRGKRQQLERAIVNVLDNAVKWSPPASSVEVRLDRGSLTVRDRGSGIPAADLPHVFDRFYRSPSARSRPGSGLGLAIVRRVVDDHGGSVSLTRADDGGTVATIRLPVADGASMTTSA